MIYTNITLPPYSVIKYYDKLRKHRIVVNNTPHLIDIQHPCNGWLKIYYGNKVKVVSFNLNEDTSNDYSYYNKEFAQDIIDLLANVITLHFKQCSLTYKKLKKDFSQARKHIDRILWVAPENGQITIYSNKMRTIRPLLSMGDSRTPIQTQNYIMSILTLILHYNEIVTHNLLHPAIVLMSSIPHYARISNCELSSIHVPFNQWFKFEPNAGINKIDESFIWKNKQISYSKVDNTNAKRETNNK